MAGRRKIYRFARSRASRVKWLALGIGAELLGIMLVMIQIVSHAPEENTKFAEANKNSGDYIHYVEFNPTYEALCRAYELDVKSHEKQDTKAAEKSDDTEKTVSWIDLLAYAAAKNGGEFGKNALSCVDEAAESLESGTSLEELTEGMEYFNYYEKAYTAVLGGMVGTFQEETGDGSMKEQYGLMAYSPIAEGFDYSSGDDFGSARSYGYNRPHLGHDMMGLIGTPIIAVESGYVEALGWNQYGGWRIGIRSFDRQRYYYYAHLRQDRPYAEGLKEGDIVTAGDVIGYMGHTGYSKKENVNNIEVVHLHFGMELVFDESQKESDNEIWINCYPLTEFLKKHRSAVTRDEKTKEWSRTTKICIPEVEKQKEQ